jgi:hypothetical protein
MAPLSRRVSLVVAIWAGALGICAQTLPSTGSIHGTALDEQGAPLPGVAVKLLGAGERAPVQTDAQGEFRFLYISPGTYGVTLSLDAFATVENQGIVVALDRSTQLRVTMKLASVTETVTVSGAPAIDPRKTVTGATFGEKELQAIPSARNIWATLWAVPGVVTNQVNVGGNTAVQANPSSKGVTGATYNLDGADITVSGLSPTFYNFDSFQEVQVVTGGSDVTLLNGGATFNMVTRRGANTIHGSARYFYAPDRWQTENTPAEVNPAQLSTNRTNVLRDYGIEAGGAVLSDRLWLWGAWGKNQIDLQRLGQLDTEGRQVNENSTLENFDARLDAQLAASNSLELYYHHGDRVQDGRGVDINTAPESGFNLTQPVPIYKIADTQVFSSSLTATAFFSYMDFRQTATPVGGVDTPMYIDATGVLRGSSPASQTHSIVRQGGASASKFFTTGSLSHELKVGFGYRSATTDVSSSYPGGGVWGDEFLGLAYVTRAAVGTTQDQRLGVFVSDTLSSDRLTVSAGVRYDDGRARNAAASVPANPEYPDILPAVQYPGDEGYPISAGRWQPRVGATYALGQKRQTLLRASYSRFADLFLDGINLASPFPTTQGIYYYWEDTNGNHLVDPDELDFDNRAGFYNVDPANPGAASAPNQISPNLKPTTVDEVVVGADQELFAGLTASVHYTYRSIRGIVFSPYIGVTAGGGGYAYAGNATGSATDPHGFTVAFDVPYFGVTLDPPPTGVVLENRPGYSQTYQGVSLQLVKALSDRWLFRGTFSWNSWIQSVSPDGIFDPNNGPMGPNDNGGQVNGGPASAWVVSVSGLYQLPLGFSVSGAFSARQGFPQQYLVLVFPHDTVGNPIFVLTSPVGTYRLPNVYELDLRLGNTFTIGPVAVTPSLNVFNATNANTVLFRRGLTGTYNSARDVPFIKDPRFNAISDFESPRIFQAAIQIAF